MPVQWKRRRYTPEQFTEAWTSSRSIAEVAAKLACNKTGGGYTSLRNAADDLGLTRDHMSGQGWNIGEHARPINPARPLAEYLVLGSTIASNYLKTRLYREGVKTKQCEECGLTEWRGKPAPLALEHINGNKHDNRIENLSILCYNCHGLTSTFAGKNIGKNKPF